MIHEIKTYQNEAGEIIQERTPIEELGVMAGKLMNGALPKYTAQAVLNFQLPNGQQGQMPFVFDIDGTNPVEAFGNFKAAFDKAKAGAEAELRLKFAAAQRQLVLPNGQTLPPMGKPKTRVAR